MNRHTISKGIAALSKLDPDLAAAVEQVGPPEPRHRPAGFETLLYTVISQQISAQAARAVKSRVTALMSVVSAENLLQLDDSELRHAGLSFRKISYAKDLAAAILGGSFDIDGLAGMSDQAAIESITALRGFGRWSAEVYLMFSLDRQDIFPTGDLALQQALRRLKGCDGKPTPAQAGALVAHWSPWRTVGALFLWHYYRGTPQVS